MKIAVVGGGISGLSTALILNSQHEVHLFDAEPRLGGHAHTVSVDSGKGSPVFLDTGFLVYNTLTYPHFTKFLDYLNVETAISDMSLSIMSDDGFEWAGTNLATVFAQKRNALNPSFLRMLTDIVRFNREAETNLNLSRLNRWTLGDLLRQRKYNETFQRLYILPMTGAIWSMSYLDTLKFPAETFLNFCLNHRLLQIFNRPVWRTIRNGSINYVSKVQAKLQKVHLSARVESIRKCEGKLKLRVSGSEADFDIVVFATHPPTTHTLVAKEFPELAKILFPFKITHNNVDLHSDESLMPKNKNCWSAWNVKAQNFMHESKQIALTYYINKLQPINSHRQHFITMNSTKNISKIERSFQYDHPQFDFNAIEVQKRLPDVQGRDGIYLAGAWTRYGFHEDGILSAVNVAKRIGVEAPWL